MFSRTYHYDSVKPARRLHLALARFTVPDQSSCRAIDSRAPNGRHFRLMLRRDLPFPVNGGAGERTSSGGHAANGSDGARGLAPAGDTRGGGYISRIRMANNTRRAGSTLRIRNHQTARRSQSPLRCLRGLVHEEPMRSRARPPQLRSKEVFCNFA